MLFFPATTSVCNFLKEIVHFADFFFFSNKEHVSKPQILVYHEINQLIPYVF